MATPDKSRVCLGIVSAPQGLQGAVRIRSYTAQQEDIASYGPLSDEAGEPSSDLLTVKLRWKQPAGSTSTLAEFPLAERGGSFESASADLRFASAVASFGMLLRGSAEAGAVTFAKTAQIASEALGADVGGYRTEFVDLVRKAGGN